MKIKRNKITPYVLVFSLVIICFLKAFFCSVSPSGDVFFFMTADYWNFGKGILGGQRLYIDLMDHKGTYLFWVYSLMHIVSNGNVFAVAICETIWFAIMVASFYVFSLKIGHDKHKSLGRTLFFCIAQFVITQKVTLINTESLLVPFFFYVNYVAVYKNRVKFWDFFSIGLVIGLFATIKYSVILYFACPFLLASYKIIKSDGGWKHYAKLVLGGLLGVLISVAPFFVYLVKTGTYKTYFELMRLASSLDVANSVAMLTVFVAFFVLTLFLYSKGNEQHKYFFCFSCFFCSLIGGTSTIYSLVLIFSMLSPCLYINFKIKVRDVMVLILMTIFLCCALNIRANEKSQTSTLSKRYGLNNKNTLYLTEDCGYGVNKKELFIVPFQWLPARMIENEDFFEYYLELSKQRVLNCEFEFVSGYGNFDAEMLPVSERVKSMWKELETLLEQNYVKIEEELIPSCQSLWVLKSSSSLPKASTAN